MKQKRKPEVSGVSSLFNMLPRCCSRPISICRYQLPATESSVDAHSFFFFPLRPFFFLASLIISIHSRLPPVSESELLSEPRSGTDALLPSS